MASPTLTRSRHEPATRSAPTDPATTAGTTSSHGAARALLRRTGTSRGARRSQLRAQWLVLAAALTLLAGVLVAWALDRAADRVDVVSVARPVAAGSVIQADDLTVTAIAFDAPVTGLAPATSLQALVGRVATVDLEPGTLLSVGMWADGSELSPGERTVGALLEQGTYPTGITAGSTVQAVSLTGDDGEPVVARVLDADTDDRSGLLVTLAVPDADAARLARLAASGQLVLVGVPAAPSTVDDATADDVPTGKTGAADEAGAAQP